MKTRIRGEFVVGYDESLGSHEIIRNGEVVFEGNTVLFVGKNYPHPVDREIHAGRALVSPGFVNAHSCMDISTFQFFFDLPRERAKGYRSELRKEDLFQGKDFIFGPSEIRAGATLSFLNMVLGGTTTMAGITSYPFKAWNDPVWEPEIYMEAAVRVGIRAYLSHQFRDRVNGVVDRERGEEGLQRAVRFIERFHGSFDDTIRGLFFPYTLDSNSDEQLRATREAADALGVGIRMHFAQSPEEVEVIESLYGKTPGDFLGDLGFLQNDVLLTHCLFPAGVNPSVEERDRVLDMFVDRGVNIGHCPWVLIIRGFGPIYLSSMSDYLQRGLNVCLGTDTFPQDMVQEMRWGAIMAKAAHGHREHVGTAREVFDAATVNGAKFLGRDDIGRLAPGAKADIVIADLTDYNIGPLADPIRSLVYFGTGRNIRTVIMNGTTVVDNFQHVSLDAEEVVRASQPVSDKVRDTLIRWDGQVSLDEMPPPTYPMR